MLTKRAIWADTKEFAGEVAVDMSSGNLSFIQGPPELREAVLETPVVITDMSFKVDDDTWGVATAVVPVDSPDFGLILGGVLRPHGFLLR